MIIGYVQRRLEILMNCQAELPTVFECDFINLHGLRIVRKFITVHACGHVCVMSYGSYIPRDAKKWKGVTKVRHLRTDGRSDPHIEMLWRKEKEATRASPSIEPWLSPEATRGSGKLPVHTVGIRLSPEFTRGLGWPLEATEGSGKPWPLTLQRPIWGQLFKIVFF